MSLETQLEQVAADVNTIKENVATVYNAGYKAGANVVEEHVSNADVHTSLEEKQNLNARITSVEDVVENWMTMIDETEQRAISAETKADEAVTSASGAVQKAEDVQSDLEEHVNNTDIHTTAAEKEVWNNKAEKDHAHNEYAKLTDVPSKVSELENDSDYADVRYVYDKTSDVLTYAMNLEDLKADKATIITPTDTALSFEFSANHNTEIRTGELTTLSFTFGNGEYAEDYASGLSFDSGETPTAIDYTDSGILNWVGTDCATSDGLSIFQPSANTHYDIVFYFNGVQFIGLVNGFIPATGNEAV